jgi:hypothetical protein
MPVLHPVAFYPPLTDKPRCPCVRALLARADGANVSAADQILRVQYAPVPHNCVYVYTLASCFRRLLDTTPKGICARSPAECKLQLSTLEYWTQAIYSLHLSLHIVMCVSHRLPAFLTKGRFTAWCTCLQLWPWGTRIDHVSRISTLCLYARVSLSTQTPSSA